MEQGRQGPAWMEKAFGGRRRLFRSPPEMLHHVPETRRFLDCDRGEASAMSTKEGMGEQHLSCACLGLNSGANAC